MCPTAPFPLQTLTLKPQLEGVDVENERLGKSHETKKTDRKHDSIDT